MYMSYLTTTCNLTV